MAKFGQLYLNEGTHNGKQILSTPWIKESTTMNQNQYGYHGGYEKRMESFHTVQWAMVGM